MKDSHHKLDSDEGSKGIKGFENVEIALRSPKFIDGSMVEVQGALAGL